MICFLTLWHTLSSCSHQCFFYFCLDGKLIWWCIDCMVLLGSRSHASERDLIWRRCRKPLNTLTKITGVVSTVRDLSPTGWPWGAHRGRGVGVIHVSPGYWVLRCQSGPRSREQQRRRQLSKAQWLQEIHLSVSKATLPEMKTWLYAFYTYSVS